MPSKNQSKSMTGADDQAANQGAIVASEVQSLMGARTPRVVHVLRTLAPGGVEYWLRDLVASGGVPGFALEILVEQMGGPLEPFFWAHGVPVDQWSKFRPAALYQPLRGAAIVHSHVHAASGWVLAVAAAAGVPVRVAQSHCQEDPADGGLGRLVYAALMRRCFDWAGTDRVAVSRAAGQALFGRGADFEILPPARNLAALPQRAPYRTAGPDLVLGHVGRTEPVKNQRLLEALLEAEPSWRLVVASDGGWRGGAAANRVRSATPREVLAEADCFVFPSWREGLGLAAIEAQAAGLPVVLSTGVPEEAVVRPGLVERVPPGAPVADWARAVREITVRVSMAPPGGWHQAASLYHIDRNREHLAAFYEGALQKTSSIPELLAEAKRAPRAEQFS